MSPNALKKFLNENVVIVNNKAINKKTNKHIQACMPMHTFGMPFVELMKLQTYVLNGISLIEDCAESLWQLSQMELCWETLVQYLPFSFNGNKLITLAEVAA